MCSVSLTADYYTRLSAICVVPAARLTCGLAQFRTLRIASHSCSATYQNAVTDFCCAMNEVFSVGVVAGSGRSGIMAIFNDSNVAHTCLYSLASRVVEVLRAMGVCVQ